MAMTEAQRRKLAQRDLYHPVHHREVVTRRDYTYHVPSKVAVTKHPATRITPRILKRKKFKIVPKLHTRELPILERGIDVAQDITTRLAYGIRDIGKDIQRQVLKEQRPLQEPILFGGFISKGERVGRLAVTPTPERIGVPRVDVSPVTEAERIRMPSIVTDPVTMLKKGVVVAATPFGLAHAVSGVHKKLTSMYEGIAPPPEQRLYEQQFRKMELDVSIFETKWDPHIKDEQFVGSEAQYKQMLKEHTALETQQSKVLQEYSGVGEPLSIKAERKLAGYWTAPIYTTTERGIEEYTKWLHKEMRWDKPLPETLGVRQFIGTGKYVAEHFPSMVISPLAMIPSGIEAVVREPKRMQEAVLPGLAYMGKGMVEEAVKDPLGFAATMIVGAAATKGMGRVSPIKYTGPIKILTGKEIYKTKYAIGTRIPKELETALKMDTGKLILQEQISGLPLSKVTYKIPEMLTYRGLYGARPSKVPFRGIQPLVGEISPARLGIPEISIGAPKVSFKPYLGTTGIEHAILRPSIIRQLDPTEAKAFVAIEDIMARYQKLEALAPHPFFAGVKRLKMAERDPILTWMREHPEQKTVLGGSAAIRAETVMGRVGKDIDIYVKSTETAMRDLNVLMQQEGAKTRMRGTTIERIDEGMWHHAIDIHERLHEQLGLGFETKPTIKLPVEYGEPIPVGISSYLRYEKKMGRLFSVKPSKTLIEEMGAAGVYRPAAKHLGKIEWAPEYGFHPIKSFKKRRKIERELEEVGSEKVMKEMEKHYEEYYGEKMGLPRGFTTEAILKQQLLQTKKGILTHEALHHEYPFLTEPQVKGLEIQAGLRGLPESVFVKRKFAYLEAIPLGELLIRKGISIMRPRGKGKIGPVEWRMKDIEDFLSISEELYRSSYPSKIPGIKQLHIRELKALEKDIRAVEEWKGTPPEHVSEFLGIEEAKMPTRAALGYSEMMLGRKLLDVPRIKEKLITEVPTKPKIGWDVEEFFGKEPAPLKEPLYWEAQHKKYRGFDVDVRLDVKHLDRLNAALEKRLVSVCTGHTHRIELGGFLSDVPEIGIHYLRGRHLARRIKAMRGVPGMKVRGGEGFVTIKGLKKSTPEWWEGTTTMLEELASSKRFKRVPFKSVEDIMQERGVIPEIAPVVKDKPSYMMDIGPTYKPSIRDVAPLIEIPKLIDTPTYYPKRKRVVPSDYYPKMIVPTLLKPLYPYIMKPYRQPRMKKVAYPIYDISFDIYPTFIPSGYPKRILEIVPMGYPIPTPVPIKELIPGFYPHKEILRERDRIPEFYIDKDIIHTRKIIPEHYKQIIPEYILHEYVTHRKITPYPEQVPVLIPPPPTLGRILMPDEKKRRRRKKKYKFEEFPWKERHHIPTLEELMQLPTGMKVTPPAQFGMIEMKLPKLPKGLM